VTVRRRSRQVERFAPQPVLLLFGELPALLDGLGLIRVMGSPLGGASAKENVNEGSMYICDRVGSRWLYSCP
jgi:hypothetical protein